MALESTARILVVEDEALIRWDLTSRLEEAGYETVEAGSADEAMNILENDRDIRIVFTDIQMPGTMDGLELARYVRARWPPTIIVISSGKHPKDMKSVPDNIELFAKPFDWGKWKPLLADLERRLSTI
jgi:CheY-like chemotaxis protein